MPVILSPSMRDEISKPSLQFYPGAGYWIAPDGHAFPVTTHIAAICECPERFGLDASYLRDTFSRHRETWATEGNARVEVILTVINISGWIRVRHYRRTGWTVNVPTLDPPVLDHLVRFFQLLFPTRVHLDNIRLDYPNGLIETSLQDLKGHVDNPFIWKHLRGKRRAKSPPRI